MKWLHSAHDRLLARSEARLWARREEVLRRASEVKRTGHWIRPTIDAGMGDVDLTVTCHEPEGAECRRVVVREAELTLRFGSGLTLLDQEPDLTEDGGYCQWVDWFAQDGLVAEYYEGPNGHLVVEGPISIRWEMPRGEDDDGSFNWMYVE